MSCPQVNEENALRLYGELMKVVEGADMDDAACALCSVLTIKAYNKGYSYRGLRYMVLGSIRTGWRRLKKLGLPNELAFDHTNGGENDEQTQTET